MNVYVVEKCSNFTDGNGHMFIHRIFENLEDARNYVMQCDGIFGSLQQLNDSYIDKTGMLRENWNGYDISEYHVIPKQPEPEKNWRFSYKVFHLTNDKEQLFKFVNEIEDEGKYLNSELAKLAADDILKNPNLQLCSSQKWQNHADPNGGEIYAKNVYVTGKHMDKGEELFYQFKVYEVK